MSFDAIVTIGVIVSSAVALGLSVAGPDIVLVGALVVLLTFGVLEPSEALAGFASPALATIAALFVVAAGVRNTGVLSTLARRFLGEPKSRFAAQLRVMLPVATLSSFINNTPVVAMGVPMVQTWARQIGMSSSLFLLPLSYAAILGGMCTLFGTSTNLLVAELYKSHAGEPLGIFDTAILGIPVAVLGFIYLLTMSPRLLRDHTPSRAGFEDTKEYAITFRVDDDSPVLGRSIEESLRALPKLFLFELERDGEVFPAVDPSTRLRAGDLLVFAGIVVDAAVDLRKLGLTPAADQVTKLRGSRKRVWFEAVISANGKLAGKTVKESRFRTRYNAAILAVHRQGQRVGEKVGDIRLQPGDVLLLEGPKNFVSQHRGDASFVLLSEIEGSQPPQRDRVLAAVGILAAMVISVATGLLPLITAAMLAAFAIVLSRCLSAPDARRALDLRVLLTIGASIGIGSAVQSSGLATMIGEQLLSLVSGVTPFLVLFVLFVLTALVAAFIYTATAAVLMFPIAMLLAEELSLPAKAVALLVMLGACSAFSTPIGYAANLMVYGPGGYRYTDFLKVGLPLQMLIGALASGTVTWLWL